MSGRQHIPGKVLPGAVALLALVAAFPMHRCACARAGDAGAAMACCAGHACCCNDKVREGEDDVSLAAPCRLQTYHPVPAPVTPVTEVAASMVPTLDAPIGIGPTLVAGIRDDIPSPAGDCCRTKRHAVLHVFLI